MTDETARRAASKNSREPMFAAAGVLGQGTDELYEFGPFRLDPAERKLSRNNEPVVLTPKAFDTLVILVRNSGHLLEKDELIRTLWPDSFVEEGNLSNNIFVLRKALGEDPQYIETVPKRGYRFVGAVRQLPKTVSASHEGRETELKLASETIPERRRSVGTVVVPSRSARLGRTFAVIVAAGLGLLAIGAGFWSRRPVRSADRANWVQLTNFPDSVTQPTLSPDGHMLAFIRGYSTWVGDGQIYVKILPDGEPVQLTHDSVLKTDPAFSPDGSRIAYTSLNLKGFGWDTAVLPILGGEPQSLLRNASGLTWIDPNHVMFSEIKAGVHMGIVTAEEGRFGARDVYLPGDESAMAHRSYLSPDKKWVLLVEMDKDHYFLPCRLVPMDGSSQGRHVGPLGGSCTSAAWSPDGKWMYFTANPGGVSHHIWRQPFPDGSPEQITSGPTEEEGIAMAPDGRSFVTAVALQSTSLWMHDAKGEHQVSIEENATNPKFTPDGKKLCYLVAREATNDFAWYRNPGELHFVDLQSGRSETFQRGFPIQDYDISADSQRVVMWTTGRDGKSQFWVAPLDRSAAPVQIPNVEGATPMFGPDGDIFFRRVEKTSTFIYRVRPDGSRLEKAFPEPIFVFLGVSPQGKWIIGWAPLPGNGPPAIQAFPVDGGPAVVIGPTHTFLSWSLDGRSALLAGSYLVPLPAGDLLPRIPNGGFQSDEEIARLPGARRIEGGGVVLGPSADVYAFYRGTIQRNLYRIPIP